MSREEELSALVDELRKAVEARDAFLAIAAHELRNPMHALGLSLGLALRTAEGIGNAELIQRLQGAKLSLDRYVERATTLLDVSRITHSNLRLHLEPLDFAAIVRLVAASYEAEAKFTGATLRLSLPDSLPGAADKLAIEQVVGNLLSNAIKYGAGAPVDVTLAQETTLAVLTVRDHGIGISAEDQARIFGRFEQVVQRQSRAGFGVGLWLVRMLAEAHGGTIEVESAPNVGSCFTVRFPLGPIRDEL